MKPRSVFHSLVLVWCALALVAAQVNGSRALFLCFCGGQIVSTQSSHCHGPHGADCHEQESALSEGHSEEGKGECREHQALAQDLEVRSALVASTLVAPPLLLAVLPSVALLPPPLVSGSQSGAREGLEGSPPIGVSVARSIVLRI